MIDEIVNVTGLDLSFVGMYELSASMGVLGQIDRLGIMSLNNEFYCKHSVLV
jgi:2-keto-3-deoxy-L-rhamnonate aldolase RhmA